MLDHLDTPPIPLPGDRQQCDPCADGDHDACNDPDGVSRDVYGQVEDVTACCCWSTTEWGARALGWEIEWREEMGELHRG